MFASIFPVRMPLFTQHLSTRSGRHPLSLSYPCPNAAAHLDSLRSFPCKCEADHLVTLLR